MKQKLVWLICQVSGDFTRGMMEVSVYSHQHNTWGNYWGTESSNYSLYDSEEEARKVLNLMNGTKQFLESRWIDLESNWGKHK